MSKGMKFYPPDTINILSPRPSISPRGVNAQKERDPMRSMRFPDRMWEPIREAADTLGMTISEFVRWTAFASANEVLRLARTSGVSIETQPVDRIIDKTARPKYDKVLVVSDGGSSLSVLEQESAKLKQNGIDSKKARPLSEIMNEISQKNKMPT